MRAAKISETVSALSSGRRASARRALQAFAYSAPSDGDDNSTKNSLSDSDLSTPPLSSDSEPTAPSSGRRGKRKRETIGTPTTATSTDTSQPKRSSSRKAPKLEKQSIKKEDVKPRAKRQPAKKIKNEDNTVTLDPPPNWEEIWDVTAAMRKRTVAPVDTMGCENLAEEHRSPLDRRLQTLVALMLSSQTKDTVTAVAMKNLQEGLAGGFNLQALLDVGPEELNRMIGSVGFHNNKTKYIKATAVILRDQFDGDIPDTIDGLISLPGVGPKMAYLTMSSAWGRDEGIGVDVHVHRITNLWAWHKTNTPEQTRAALESWLPRERWHAINHMLVGLGQTICLPVGRRCGECDLNEKKLCPSAVAGSPRKKKVVKKEVEVKLDDAEPSVKAEEVIVEEHDTAATVQIKSEDVGNAILQGIPDIEDLGRG